MYVGYIDTHLHKKGWTFMNKKKDDYPGIKALGELMRKSPLMKHILQQSMKKALEMSAKEPKETTEKNK